MSFAIAAKLAQPVPLQLGEASAELTRFETVWPKSVGTLPSCQLGIDLPPRHRTYPKGAAVAVATCHGAADFVAFNQAAQKACRRLPAEKNQPLGVPAFLESENEIRSCLVTGEPGS